MPTVRSAFTVALLATVSAWPNPSSAQELVRFPDADTLFVQPIAVAAPANDGRVFVVERCGPIRVVQNGQLLAQPFLTVPTFCTDEYGVLGLAFHPDFQENGIFYVAHSAAPGEPQLGGDVDQKITRYTVSPPTANVASPDGSVVLRLPNYRRNHVAGDLHFGPDGYLYWSMGDGGNEDTNTEGLAQCTKRKLADNNPASCGVIPPGNTEPVYYLRGKIIRIDVDHTTASAPSNMCGVPTGQPAPYALPPGNPFANTAQYPDDCGEILHWGLRNPYRFSFDRLTGHLFIGDVGAGAYEEINFAAAGSGGKNFQWPICEGYISHPGNAPCNGPSGSVPPRLVYNHVVGCAVVGGYVYRGADSALRGSYLFSDFCSGDIYRVANPDPALAEWSHTVMPGTPAMNSYSFGEDAAGNLYITSGNESNTPSPVYRFPAETGDLVFSDGFDP